MDLLDQPIAGDTTPFTRPQQDKLDVPELPQVQRIGLSPIVFVSHTYDMPIT